MYAHICCTGQCIYGNVICLELKLIRLLSVFLCEKQDMFINFKVVGIYIVDLFKCEKLF